MQFPKLTKDLGPIYATHKSKKKERYGIYKCICGEEFKCATRHIKSRSTKSCGCMKSKLVSDSKIKHGLANHRIFKIFVGMKTRCYNKKNKLYKYYGGKGTKVCKEWQDDFILFYNWAISNGYDDNLSIDRIDNDGDYEPDNCRWTNRYIQSQNTVMLRKNNTSGYRGVTLVPSTGRWSSCIQVNNKRIRIGTFDTREEAAENYNNYVVSNRLKHTLTIIKS